MATWPDPRALSVGFAFGSTQYDDPTGLTYETVSPGDDPDTGNDPGPVLETVTISRGRTGNAAETAPTAVDLWMRNTNGEFSPQNVSGSRWGTLRPGTPLEVALDVGSGPQALARVSALDFLPIRSGPGIDPLVQVPALGALTRLARDGEVRSAIKHTLLASSTPRAYWPLEDGLRADSAGAGTADVGSMKTVGGTITFARDETLPGSAATPDMSAGALRGRVPSGSAASWYIEFWVSAEYNAGSRAAYFITTSEDVTTWGLRQPASASGSWEVFVTDSAGGSVATIAGPVTGWDAGSGTWHHFAVTAEQSGSNITVRLYDGGSLLVEDIIASKTLGAVTDIYANDFDAFAFADLLSISHVAIGDGLTFSDSYLAGEAYDGEVAADRIERLATEAGIPISVPFYDRSSAMGPQRPGTTYRLMRDAEDVDGGDLFDGRDGRLKFVGLGRKLPRSWSNATPAMTLAFGTEADPGDVSDLISGDGDRDTYNIVTVSSPDGSFALAERTDGSKGSDTVTGVGPRPVSTVRNVADADQLADWANWLLLRTTAEQPPYVVVLDLYANTDLAADWIASDLGSRIKVTDPPAEDYGPEDLDLIIVGEEIEFGADRGLVSLWCEPYAPYDVGTYGTASTATKRYDTLHSTTAEALDTTETGVDVTNGGAQWGTQTPYDIVIGGERMTVTAVSGTGASQTLTVTRSVNGIVKSHDSGAQVRIVPESRAFRAL